MGSGAMSRGRFGIISCRCGSNALNVRGAFRHIMSRQLPHIEVVYDEDVSFSGRCILRFGRYVQNRYDAPSKPTVLRAGSLISSTLTIPLVNREAAAQRRNSYSQCLYNSIVSMNFRRMF